MVEENYENLYEDEGFYWIATAPVHIPWYRCTLRCKCIREQVMSELDSIFCKCIEQKINTISDIAFVLSLDSRIVQGELEELEALNIIDETEDYYEFTKVGKECFEKHSKSEYIIEDFVVYMNGITGEWFTELSPETLKIDENENMGINKLQETITIQPMRTVQKIDIENDSNIRAELEWKYDKHILSVTLQDYISNEYYVEKLLIYKKEDSKKVKIAFLDEVMGELDLKVGSVLTQKYERRELLEILKVENFVEEYEQHILDSTSYISEYCNSIGQCRYYRNQEIRELFKQSFLSAKESIYIISPWIDNQDYVVNDDLLQKIEHALSERKIKISIGYGYSSYEKYQGMIHFMEKSTDSEMKKRNKDWQTELMARKLNEKFSKYASYQMFYVGSHEKILIIDDRYCFVGSFNLLSYDGGEQDGFKGYYFRFEGGVMIEDFELAKDIKYRIKNQI